MSKARSNWSAERDRVKAAGRQQALANAHMRVIHFERCWGDGRFSVERLFSQIRSSFPRAIKISVVRCPTPSHSIWWLPLGLFRAWRSKGEVNHIAGDIHYIALALPGRQTILTVHDLNHLDQLSGLRRRIFQLLYFDLPVRHCRYITTISDHTREQLVHMYPSIDAKVHVIPNCVAAGCIGSAKSFCKSRPRLLQVGTRPNKNLERVAAALAGLDCMLHIVGRLSDTQKQLLTKYGISYENDVNVSDQDMMNAYRQADLVLFASTMEGFGVPIIEAQAVGRPVVTSKVAPMDSVAGGAACLVNPYDVDDIRAGVTAVLRDDIYRDNLVKCGYENAARFRPEVIAAQYVQLYEDVWKNSGRRPANYCTLLNR